MVVLISTMESKSDDRGQWNHIEFKDLELGDRIGGGGVGVIYKGYFGNTQVLPRPHSGTLPSPPKYAVPP